MRANQSQIFGKNDNHVPPEGRDLIRKTLHEKGVVFGFYEAAWAQREFDTWFDGSIADEVPRCVYPG